MYKHLIALWLLISLTTSSLSHSWYPWECCSTNDCQPVACDELLEDNKGGIKYLEHYFTKDKVKPSQDSQCHVCINHGKPICVFIQQNT